MFDPSAAGAAIFFVLMLAMAMIVGTYVLTYAAHCLVTVVVQTAAGNDEVTWQEGPFLDWLWEAAYMLWLTAVWLGPIALAAKAGAAGHGVALFVAAGLVWLFFPISLLSSMSSTSKWVLLSPRLVSRLLGQRFGSLLVFYLHSGAVVACVSGLIYLTFFRAGGMWLLLVTGAGLSAGLLIYSRQLGRLAHLVEHTRSPSSRPRRTAHRHAQARAAAHDPWSSEGNRPRQPSELPPVMSPLEGPITGYDVRFDDGPLPDAPPPPRKRPPDLDDVPYDLVGSPNVDPPRGPLPKDFTEPSEYEMALARGGAAPPPPAHPWATGVYNFPFYSESLTPFLALGAGFALLGGMIWTMMPFRP